MRPFDFIVWGVFVWHASEAWWWPEAFERLGGWAGLAIGLAIYGLVLRWVVWRIVAREGMLVRLFEQACLVIRSPLDRNAREALRAMVEEHDRRFARVDGP